MNAGLSTKNAPSPIVVLPHYVFGAVAFLVASVMLFFISGDIVKSNVGPGVLSVTHILVLGWITMVIYGALYQLIPVVMEVRLGSELLAHISFGTMAVGTVLLSLSFWRTYIMPNILVEIGGTLIFISALLFAINALISAKKSERRTIENTFIITSIFWLLFTIALGIVMIINAKKHFLAPSSVELLQIHAAAALIGWFMMLVIGVASTLMPMFFIAHNLNRTLLKISYGLINIGLIGLIVSLYAMADTILPAIFAFLIVAGMLLFVMFNYSAYKKRLRRKLDIGMKLSVLAFALLALTLVSAVVAALDLELLKNWNVKFDLAYGISLILGFFTALILGQMYKTLPFIVWLQKYQDKVGKFKIPMPASLYSEKVADAHYYSFIAGFVLLIIAIFTTLPVLAQISSVFFIITALLYGYNTFMIVFHKEDIKPLKS